VRTDVLLIGNDNVVSLDGLRNGIDAAFINGAAVTATLTTLSGEAVVGQTFPAAMEYVPDSNGVYRLMLRSTLAMVNGHYYKLTISAIGNGLTASWTQLYKATLRAQ
jgi:hypothetical protein